MKYILQQIIIMISTFRTHGFTTQLALCEMALCFMVQLASYFT